MKENCLPTGVEVSTQEREGGVLDSVTEELGLSLINSADS